MVGHAPRRLIVEISSASGIAARDLFGRDAGESPRRGQDVAGEKPVT